MVQEGGFLVGREDVVDALAAVVARARTSTPQVVLIEGPPGVGKTAVLAHLTSSVQPGFIVLHSSGAEAEQRLDFGIIDQLMREVRAVGLRAPAPVTKASARPDPLVVGDGLYELVQKHTVGRPSLIVVDDAQWADATSLQTVAYIVRRLRDVPLVVAIAHRDDATQLEPLRRLVRDSDAGLRLTLRGLTAGALRELVRNELGVELTPVAADRLHVHTDGSPLHALTVVEELGEAAMLGGFGPLPAPRSYASLVLSRLAQCSPAAEAVVAAVSVLGRPSDLVTVAAVVDADQLAPGMSEAVERGLLRVDVRAGRRVVDVGHPLQRAAVLDDLPPGRLAALHHAAALATGDEDRTMLHRIRAVLGEDPAVAAEAVALARRRLATGWEQSAIELLVGAAGLLPVGPAQAQAVLLAADRLLDMGSTAAADELVATVRPGDGGALEHLVRGRSALVTGSPDRAIVELEAAWESVGDESVAARAAGLIATASANAGHAGKALMWSRRALERAVGQPLGASSSAVPTGNGDVGHALTMLASAWALRNDLAAGRAEVEEWLARLTGAAARADGLLARGVLALWDGRHDEAVETLRQVVDTTGRNGPLLTRANAEYSLADADYRGGRWDEALERAERLAGQLEDLGQPLPAPMAHGVAAFVLGGRGAFVDADAHVLAGRRALKATGAIAGALWIEIAAARVAFARGDHESVVDGLMPLAAVLRDVTLPEGVLPWQADLAESLLATGRIDDAAAELDVLDERLGGGGLHAAAGAARARALLAAARGDDDLANRTFTAALEAPADQTGPFVRARLELAAGAFERRRGQRRRAAALLTRALDRFVALGAEPYRARAAKELDGCGLAPRRRGESDQRSLTPAEAAIAALVADGRTNREVAAELVVSVKTVESHLARVFAKLGVRSRTELAKRWHAESMPAP